MLTPSACANGSTRTDPGPPSAKLPNRVHASRDWRIHELVGDFRLEDVWALPTPGCEREDCSRFVEGMAAGDTSESPSRAARALWAIRWKLGELFGWDDPKAGLDTRVASLRNRMPVDLREAPRGPKPERLPFTSLYQLDDELAAEIANKTVHGVMHVGWVPDGAGGCRGEMAVYVKPNGPLGVAYMAAIKPFRYLVVYPPMLKQVKRVWLGEKAGTGTASGPGASPAARRGTSGRRGARRSGVVQPRVMGDYDHIPAKVATWMRLESES